MKRRLSLLLLAFAAVFTLTVPAFADVIWEPNDAFYTSHRSECTYVDRVYELAGYDGSVTVWSAPGGMALQEVDNGERGVVQFRWSGDGVEWGYIYGLDGKPGAGWVPMDDLALVYDSRQFMEDHEAELIYDTPVPVDFHSAVLYDYPGGPAGRMLDEHADYMTFTETFYPTYIDENGLRWGYVGYYMGHVESWVCLDDPVNEHLDTNIVPLAPSAAQLRGSATVAPGLGQFQLIVAGVLVVAVVVVTALAIRRVRPGKR